MTREELRATQSYKEAYEKIKSYRKGFEFTVPYWRMPTENHKRFMRFILNDCMEEGLIESIAVDFNLELETTEETYRRI